MLLAILETVYVFYTCLNIEYVIHVEDEFLNTQKFCIYGIIDVCGAFIEQKDKFLP